MFDCSQNECKSLKDKDLFRITTEGSHSMKSETGVYGHFNYIRQSAKFKIRIRCQITRFKRFLMIWNQVK